MRRLATILILAAFPFAMGYLVAEAIPVDHAGYVNISHAERDAQAHLKTVAATCPTRIAESWAEINSDMPGGYEIIAECLAPRQK